MTSLSPRASAVLVADDDPSMLRSLELLLSSWGYGVILARDGEEALAALRGENPPRVALLDWGMPRVDGLEVCRRARDLRPREPSYLILLTGRNGRDDLVAGLEGGADEYLAKPADPAELRARLHAAWRIVGLQAQLAERVRELEATPTLASVDAADVGLQRTLRLCVATFSEVLALSGMPRHLRIVLRTSRGLCLSFLGDADEGNTL